jgi:hypothetical protein
MQASFKKKKVCFRVVHRLLAEGWRSNVGSTVREKKNEKAKGRLHSMAAPRVVFRERARVSCCSRRMCVPGIGPAGSLFFFSFSLFFS